MGFSFRSTGCVKRAQECWNESHTINGSPRPAKTKEKSAGVNRRTLICHRPDDATFGAAGGTPGILRSLKLVRSRASNQGCHHNAELDGSRLPDDVTFNDLQPRMVCTVCDHRGADVSSSWLQHG
jgi:hypothetical protein